MHVLLVRFILLIVLFVRGLLFIYSYRYYIGADVLLRNKAVYKLHAIVSLCVNANASSANLPVVQNSANFFANLLVEE